MRIDSQPWTRHMAQRREQGADDHEKVGMKRIGIEFVARLVAAALAHASPCAAGRRLPKQARQQRDRLNEMAIRRL